jgi:hypothetical protein
METAAATTDSFKTKSPGVLTIDTNRSLISRGHGANSLSTLPHNYRLSARGYRGESPSEHTATTATAADI